MKNTLPLCMFLAVQPLAAATIDFESPAYTTASPLSTSPVGLTADRPFDGQQGWSRSTSDSFGNIITTTTSGSYTGGQALTGTITSSQLTYIGAKAVGAFPSFSYDLRYYPVDLGVGGWNDDDGDGLFDQSEAEFMAGTVTISSTTTFGLRTAGFGTRLSTGTSGISGHSYRMTVTPDFANLQVTLAVYDLTANAAVPLTTSTFTLTTAQFGVNPTGYEGISARVTSSSTFPAAIDNLATPAATPPEPPPPAPLPGNSVLVAANGAWTWFNDNQAIVLPNGRHLVGYVKSDGNIAAMNFDPVSASGNEIILSGTGAVEIDDHNNPSFTPLGNGNIFTAYSRHEPDKFWFRRTSTTSDPRVLADFSTQSQGPTMPRNNSYSNAFRLSAENRIYHFSRSINYNPTLTTSTDEGQTWSTPVQFIRTGTGDKRPYVRYSSNHNNRIDAIYTDGHPRDITNSLYHLTISSGAVRRSDGSLIRSTSQLPVLHDAPDLERGSPIYTYSAAAWGAGQGPNDWIPSGRAWSWDIHRGSGDQPVAVFTVRVANVTGTGWNHNRIYYYYARWDGSQWKKTFIAHAGRPLYSAEADYAGGICIDPEDPRVVYISTNAASPFALGSLTSVPLAAGERYELYRGFTADGGLTFTWEQVTVNSTADNLRPTVPENHARDRTLLWFNGTYTSYTSFATRVLGIFGSPTTSYQTWASTEGLSANSQGDDDDSDGFTNLLEYATGGDPQISDASGKTSLSAAGAFEFAAVREHSDVEWKVEQSPDLSQWSVVATLRGLSLPSTTAPGFTLEPVAGSPGRFRATATGDTGPRSFVRLKISQR